MLEKPIRCNAILFDLDGTLIDHFDTLFRCVCVAQQALGAPEITYEKLRATVGGSAPVTIRKLFGDALAERALEIFYEEFERDMFDGLRMLPGAQWLLSELRKADPERKLAVLTNKEGDSARLVLEKLGLIDMLDAVVGSKDTPFRKPQPGIVAEVLTRLERSADETALVGDSTFDIQTARAAGMPCLCVTLGTHDEPALRAAGAAGVWDSLYSLGQDAFGLPEPDQE